MGFARYAINQVEFALATRYLNSRASLQKRGTEIAKYFGEETNFNPQADYENRFLESIASRERDLRRIREEFKYLERIGKVNKAMAQSQKP